jgi:hypothetical protein
MRALFTKACRHHRLVALALAVASLMLARAYGSRVAGGSDSYGYVSEANLWLTGHLQVALPIVRDVPWPDAVWTFSPLGYKPATGDAAAMVPVYSPGLPLLMAGVTMIAGACGVYWIVPLSSALLVLATYGLGRRLGRPLVGLVGSWLVATSAAVIFAGMWPMSDVPTAAAWTIVFYCLLAESAGWALAGGLVASIAILMRPNLVPLAAVCFLWIAWRDVAERRVRSRRAGLWWFAAGVLPGPIIVALINRSLYGSALQSGYAPLNELMAWSHVPGNLVQYAAWLAQSHSPLVLAGLAVLAIPLRRFWPTLRERRALPLLIAVVAATWAFYVFYREFDAWWYLRFLLPAFPPMFIGVAAGLSALYRMRWPWIRLAAIAVIVVLGWRSVVYAKDHGAFEFRAGEERYVDVARVVRGLTEADAVVICVQHTGTLRYYGSRLTLRFDYIDRLWLDRVVDWLAARGVHAYVLLDQSEIEPFRARFAGTTVVERLRLPPILSYRSGDTQLFDALPRAGDAGTNEILPGASPNAHCARAAPPPVQLVRGTLK